MQPHAEPIARLRHGAWYRQPIAWLGAFVFAASIAGCVWIIVAGARHADVALETPHGTVFGVPSTSTPQAPPRPGEQP